MDLSRYASLLIDRYCNPALKHRTWQIAMDGSQKLPQRMLDSIRWHLVHQRDFTLLALGVAGWMRYVGGVDDAGQAIEICDPLLPVIQQAVAASADGEARVKALLGIEAIFGVELPQESRFVTAVTRAYLALQRQGLKLPSPRGPPRNNLFPVSVPGSTPALQLFLRYSADVYFLLTIGFSRRRI